MKEFVKKNFLFLIIILMLLLILGLLALPSGPGEELSMSDIKEYANELKAKSLYQEAISAYEEFLRSRSLSARIRANIHYFIAEIYRDNLKDFDKALAHFIKIKYIDPQTPLLSNVNQKIVECLENSGRSREAQIALDESTALNQKKGPKESSVILVKIDSDVLTLKDFNDWLGLLPEAVRKEYASLEKKKELLRQYVSQELTYRMALRKGLSNDPEILKREFEIKKNLMVQKLMQDELLSKVNITRNDLELYYKANKDRYKQPLSQVYQQVYQDLMQEKVQQKSQEILAQMMKANSVEIFDGNLR